MTQYVCLSGLIYLLTFIPLQSQATPLPSYVFAHFRHSGTQGMEYSVSHDGVHWQSLNQIILPPKEGYKIRDPYLFRIGSEYGLLYTAHSRGIGFAKSQDLIHWQDHKIIPMKQKNRLHHWAPKAFYYDDSYYILWSSTTGPHRWDFRLEYLRTKDFQTFSTRQTFFDLGEPIIDGLVYQANNAAYLFFKKEAGHEKRLYFVKGNDPFSFDPKAVQRLGPKTWVEGPTILKVENQWYLYFDQYTRGRYGAYLSEDLETWQPTKVSFPRGIRHGSPLKIKASHMKKLLNHHKKDLTKGIFHPKKRPFSLSTDHLRQLPVFVTPRF